MKKWMGSKNQKKTAYYYYYDPIFISNSQDFVAWGNMV